MSRQLVGVVGIAIAVAGIATNSRVLIWVAIGVLLAAVLWRLVASWRARRHHDDLSSPPDDRPKG